VVMVRVPFVMNTTDMVGDLVVEFK